MSSQASSFIEQVLAGHASLHQIDDFVDAWHEDDGKLSLHDYLGMTAEEYALWVSDPESLATIAQARRDHVPLFASSR